MSCPANNVGGFNCTPPRLSDLSTQVWFSVLLDQPSSEIIFWQATKHNSLKANSRSRGLYLSLSTPSACAGIISSRGRHKWCWPALILGLAEAGCQSLPPGLPLSYPSPPRVLLWLPTWNGEERREQRQEDNTSNIPSTRILPYAHR